MTLTLLVALLSTVATTARADETCHELPCSVMRNCSSTGMACETEDRSCATQARDKNLEVKCEQQCEQGKNKLVYCPPDTGRSDSNIVWFLLAAAGVLAVGGISGAWLLLRKKPA